MLDDGEYICLTDDDVDEDKGVVASNTKIEDKSLPRKKDKFQMSNYDVDSLSYSFDEDDELDLNESKSLIIKNVRRLTDQSFNHQQKFNENSIPSSDSHTSPTMTSHNSSSESWVPIVPRRSQNTIINNSSESSSRSNHSNGKASSDDIFEDEDIILVNSNNPTELPNVKSLKSSSPKIKQSTSLYKIGVDGLNLKSAIETPIRTDSSASSNSSKSNNSSASLKNDLKPSLAPIKLVYRGKDMQKLKETMTLDTEQYALSSSDSNSSNLNSYNSSSSSLEQSSHGNISGSRFLIDINSVSGFQNSSNSNQEQLSPNQTLLSRLPRFFLNDLKLKALPNVLDKKMTQNEIDKYFKLVKEKNKGTF